jgi:hypothetical protein
MSKRRFIGATVVGLATVALAGGLIASNMGFKLNKTLIVAGQAVSGVGEVSPFTSVNGTNTLGLPFNRQVGMNNASQLKTDIGASCVAVSKFLRSQNAAFNYTAARAGAGSIDFALEEGSGYRARVTGASNISYIIVGSDDPSYAVSLIVAGQPAPGTGETGNSINGTNEIAYKYHATSATASALKTEIGAQCVSVAKFLASTNGNFSYTAARAGAGSVDFPLIPGETYQVRVTGATNVSYVASHY